MFIGDKEIKSTEITPDKTPGGIDIVKVNYVSGKVEFFSKIMYDKIVKEKKTDLSELRDNRVRPVVEVLLAVMREWGVKLGELSYISALLNQSLDFNKDAALKELWSSWMPTPSSQDEVDLVTIDRILRAKKYTISDIIKDKK